jgi:undecaprenyl-phosphate 4-deoxy-4-formamido-L-arabinose transferase
VADPALTLVIPVYNGENVLPETLRRLGAMLERADRPLELLLVDDGSTDRSFDLLRAFRDGRPEVKVIRLARNFGIYGAMRAGFVAARSDVIASTEMCVEHDLDEIFRLVDLMRPGIDVVCGGRVRRTDAWWRRAGSWLTNRIARALCGLPIRDLNSDLRVWRRDAGLELSAVPSYGHLLATYCRLRLLEVPVDFSRHPKAPSSFTVRQLARAFAEIVVRAVAWKLGRRGPGPVRRRTTYEVQEVL